MSSNDEQLLRQTTEIVAAFVSRNPMDAGSLPSLISSVHQAFVSIVNPSAQDPQADLKPAVPIKKSVQPDYIVCLEDGKKLKMLKRHLKSAYNMTTDEYRARWGLPADYPMVAPNYAKARSDMAKVRGLGKNRRVVA